MSVLMTTRYGAIVYVCKIVQFVVCLLFIVYRWLLYVFLLFKRAEENPCKMPEFYAKTRCKQSCVCNQTSLLAC